MSGKIIETPPVLNGTQEQQIRQLYGFLFRMSENLNVALNNLTVDNFASAGEYAAVANPASKGQQPGGDKTADSYNELKALIVNTASIIQSTIDKVETTLSSKYAAISDEWGSYQENISNTIEATADGVIQRYGYDAEIRTLQELAAGFSAYQINTEGYIKQGFIDYDENNVPILGIAIGQGLTSTSVTIGGEEYKQIDSTQSCAFYTANKLSFRVNGREVAYVSNRKLYIYDVEVMGMVIFGGEWLITWPSGLKIQWIGEV